MIHELAYRLTCDICHTVFGDNENYFRLIADADVAGWKRRRKLNGEIAHRGGKDYCPDCAPVGAA